MKTVVGFLHNWFPVILIIGGATALDFKAGAIVCIVAGCGILLWRT